MRLLTMTALALGLAATTTVAQDIEIGGDGIRVDQLTGGPVYSLGETVTLTPGEVYDTIETTWTEVGTINDLVLSRAGQLIGVVAQVPGREVFLPVENANLVAGPDQEFAFVTDLSAEELAATRP